MLRNTIVGPRLMSLARLSKNDINQLVYIAGNFYLLLAEAKPSKTMRDNGETKVTAASLLDLKLQMACLIERIDVLERANPDLRSLEVPPSSAVEKRN